MREHRGDLSAIKYGSNKSKMVPYSLQSKQYIYMYINVHIYK